MFRTRLSLTRLEERETPSTLGDPIDPGTTTPPSGQTPVQSPPTDPTAPMDPSGSK